MRPRSDPEVPQVQILGLVMGVHRRHQLEERKMPELRSILGKPDFIDSYLRNPT